MIPCGDCARLKLKIKISTPPQREAWQRLLAQHELSHRTVFDEYSEMIDMMFVAWENYEDSRKAKEDRDGKL